MSRTVAQQQRPHLQRAFLCQRARDCPCRLVIHRRFPLRIPAVNKEGAVHMAPFRNRDRSNRTGRGQVEHNVLEGLPINQYRRMEISIGNNPTENKLADKDAWPGPPLPRDSHLLPEHSQQILKIARSGRIYKPSAPLEDDKDVLDEEDEHKEVSQGFVIKKWSKVPRHLEDAEPEYLAKRRKGLPSQYALDNEASAQHAPAQPVRETKVKKVDDEGNVAVYEVIAPEGQTVEGEIKEAETVIETTPIAAAPGIISEGVGIANDQGVVVSNDVIAQTPTRRRPTISKKKAGSGKIRKKVAFMEGFPQTASATSDLLAVPDIKQEGSVEPSEDGDTPLPDAGDEGEGSGEDSENDDHEEETRSPDSFKQANTSDAQADSNLPSDVNTVVTSVTSVDEERPNTPAEPMTGIETSMPITPTIKKVEDRDPSSSPEMPLSAIHSRQNSTAQVPTLSASISEATKSEAEAPVKNDIVMEKDEPLLTLNQKLALEEQETTQPDPKEIIEQDDKPEDGEPDILGSLERHLEKDSEAMASASQPK